MPARRAHAKGGRDIATLSVQDVTSAGTVPTYAAAAGGGDQFSNDGKTYLHVKNGGGSSINVTIASQVACSQGSTHNTVVAVANGAEKMIGPFPPERFNDASGFVQVTYSAVTSVTVGAFQL